MRPDKARTSWIPLFMTVATVCALLPAAPAIAQNASQIARVKAGTHCPGCNLFQADLGKLALVGRNFGRARLRQADLSLGTFTRSRFDHADLRDANLFGVLAGHADFSGADLQNASLVGGYFQQANFRHARLNGANFGGADLRGATGLSPSQLATACGDASTRLPQGLHLPSCPPPTKSE